MWPWTKSWRERHEAKKYIYTYLVTARATRSFGLRGARAWLKNIRKMAFAWSKVHGNKATPDGVHLRVERARDPLSSFSRTAEMNGSLSFRKHCIYSCDRIRDWSLFGDTFAWHDVRGAMRGPFACFLAEWVMQSAHWESGIARSTVNTAPGRVYGDACI